MPNPLKNPEAQKCLERLDAISPTTAKAMFGGWGYYSEGGPIYAIYAVDRGYFKVDDENRHHFEKAGQGPFIYYGADRPMAMQYYSIPEDDWLEPESLARWIRLGQEAAARAAAKKAGKRKPLA